MKGTLSYLMTALLFSLWVPLMAHKRHFTFSYDWFTPFKNERELELWWTQSDDGKAVSMLEFEYGITGNYVIAPYFIFEHRGGESELHGWKVENRISLGTFAFNRLLPGLYGEIKKERGEPYEAEFKLITSYMPNQDWIFSANLITERELVRRAQWEWGYTFGVSRQIHRHFWLGAEAFGRLDEKEHGAGPALVYDFAPGTRITATYVVPVEGEVPRFRMIFAYEF
jgi:hypothetical protein